MKNNPLLYGIIGFMLGGLIVSVAAVTFDKPAPTTTQTSEMSMSQMTDSLEGKSGDEFDKAFIANMIDHHQAAVDMAKLSASRAQHEEIRSLSSSIISAQEKEIHDMRTWQSMWHYSDDSPMNMSGSM